MKTEIFPYAFGRTGGASFKILLSLQDHNLNALLQEFETHTFNSHEIIKDKIIAKLYETINRVNDPQLQNILLNLKRDIYNNRNVDKYLNHITIVNNQEMAVMVEMFIRSSNKLKSLKLSIDNLYQESINNQVQQIQQVSLHFFLLNGLIFSSESIYKSVEKITAGDFPVTGKKRDMHFAMGLLKYLTRSIAKTSPFSSFNSIFALQERKKIFKPIGVARKCSKLSINNLIYLLFKKVLIADVSIKSRLNIFLNPTLTENGHVIQYFHNHDNNEAFYNIQRSDALSFLINIFGKEKTITYGELIKAVEKASGESSIQAISFVEQLLVKGIITIQLPVLIKEKDWPQKLLAGLEKLRAEENFSQITECLTSVLKNLLFSISILEKSLDTKNRKEVINGSYRHLSEQFGIVRHKLTGTEIEAIFNKLSPENLFYEDVLTDSVNPIATNFYCTKFNKVGKLHHILSTLTIKNEVRKDIASKITEIYKCSKVPLLTFYRDIYLRSMNEKKYTTYQTSLFNVIDHYLQAIHYNIFQDKIDLEKAFEDIPNEFSSCDLFVQTGNIDGRDTLVVNNILSGAMTNVSRFINLYSTSNMIEELKLQLQSLYKNSIVAELVDASIHNVNTFPCLTGYVIDVSLHVSNSQKHISLTDLFICVDDKKNVILENQEGRQIMPIDFSMESIRRRSSLMKFIDIFNDTNSEGLSALRAIYLQCILLRQPRLKVNDPVVIVPRLYFSEDVILLRKKWFINRDFLNQFFTGNSSESMQFVFFNSWRKKLKIPDHVFIKINPEENAHKPQYINLSSPILFKLFKNMAIKSNESIEITEMLPGPEHLANNNDNEPYVMEHIFSLINTAC